MDKWSAGIRVTELLVGWKYNSQKGKSLAHCTETLSGQCIYQLTISDKKYQKPTNGQQVKSLKLTELTMVL